MSEKNGTQDVKIAKLEEWRHEIKTDIKEIKETLNHVFAPGGLCNGARAQLKQNTWAIRIHWGLYTMFIAVLVKLAFFS